MILMQGCFHSQESHCVLKKTYIYIVHRTKIWYLDIPLKNNNSCGFLILLQRFLNNYLQKKEIAFSKRHLWLRMLHADIKISVYRWVFSYFRFHLWQKLNIFKTLVCIGKQQHLTCIYSFLNIAYLCRQFPFHHHNKILINNVCYI